MEAGESRLQLVFVALCLLDDVHECRIEHLLGQPVRSEVDVDVLCRVYEVVSDDLCHYVLLILVLAVYEYGLDACVLDDHSHASGDLTAIFYQDFSGVRVDDVLGCYSVNESVCESQLAVVLESSDLCQVIASLVKEQRHQH